MEGILKEVNGDMVLIDSKWYTVQSPKYMPQETEVKVSFSVDKSNPTLITFIKIYDGISGSKPKSSSRGYTPKPENSRLSTPPKGPSSAVSTYNKPQDVQDSIKRQAIGNMTSRTLIGSGLKGEALEAEIRRVYEIYKDLVG